MLKKCLCVTGERAWQSLLGLLMFSGLMLQNKAIDNDTHFLLNSGRYVMEHGIPYTEPFTIHEGLHFVLQQWPTDILFWQAYALGGYNALLLLPMIFGGMIIALHYRLCLLAAPGHRRAAYLLSLLMGAVCGVFFFTTRPQIISMTLLLAEVLFLENYARNGRVKWLFPLPVISLLLVNFHASMWLMSFCCMVPYILSGLPRKYTEKFFLVEPVPLRPLFLAAAMMFAVGFLNPYGWDGMTYVCKVFGYGHLYARINEIKPLVFSGILGKLVFTLAFILCWSYSRRRMPFRYFLFSLGTLYLALSHVRGAFFFLVLGIFALAAWGGRSFDEPAFFRRAACTRGRLASLLFLCLAIIGVRINQSPDFVNSLQNLLWGQRIYFGLAILLWLSSWLGAKDFSLPFLRKRAFAMLAVCLLLLVTANGYPARPGIDSNEPLKNAMDFLLAQAPAEEIVLWTNFNDGNYAERRGLRAYMDARAEVFIASANGRKEIFQEYIDLHDGLLDYRDFISGYGFNYFLVNNQVDALFFNMLEHDDDYEVIYEETRPDNGSLCRIYRHRGSR